MRSPWPRLQLFHKLGGAACHEDRSPPRRGLILTGPHPAAPRSVRQLVESCPSSPGCGRPYSLRRTFPNASTSTAKGGCGKSARLRVEDDARGAVSLAE